MFIKGEEGGKVGGEGDRVGDQWYVCVCWASLDVVWKEGTARDDRELVGP